MQNVHAEVNAHKCRFTSFYRIFFFKWSLAQYSVVSEFLSVRCSLDTSPMGAETTLDYTFLTRLYTTNKC